MRRGRGALLRWQGPPPPARRLGAGESPRDRAPTRRALVALVGRAEPALPSRRDAPLLAAGPAPGPPPAAAPTPGAPRTLGAPARLAPRRARRPRRPRLEARRRRAHARPDGPRVEVDPRGARARRADHSGVGAGVPGRGHGARPRRPSAPRAARGPPRADAGRADPLTSGDGQGWGLVVRARGEQVRP